MTIMESVMAFTQPAVFMEKELVWLLKLTQASASLIWVKFAIIKAISLFDFVAASFTIAWLSIKSFKDSFDLFAFHMNFLRLHQIKFGSCCSQELIWLMAFASMHL